LGIFKGEHFAHTDIAAVGVGEQSLRIYAGTSR
jgi:hypothetical protein